MKHSKKSQYTEVKNRSIYLLLSPLSKEFFIGHCRKDLLKSVFQDHFRGERPHTSDCFTKLREKNLRPCLFELEEVVCTKVEAFNYVVVWTKIFHECGYKSLNKGNIMTYIDDLLDKNVPLYNERKNVNVIDLTTCEKCLVSTYNRKTCSLKTGDVTYGRKN